MLSKKTHAIPASDPGLTNAAVLTGDRKAIFADKRVIPPFPQAGTRIAGTLHLPGAQLKAACS